MSPELIANPNSNLLSNEGPADVIEMVVIQSADPAGSQRKADLSVAPRSGKMPALPTGEGIRIYVRGFLGDRGPEFYGASGAFDVPLADSFTGIPVQVGASDCVALNNAPSEHRRGGGTEDMVQLRAGFALAEIGDGRVAIIGGAQIGPDGTPVQVEASIEIYDPATSQFFKAGQLNEPRAWHTATAIGGGRVLVVGGITGAPTGEGATLSRTAEILDLGGTVPGSTTLEGPFDTGDERSHHRAAQLGDGTVLITGGKNASGQPMATTYRFIGSDFNPQDGRFVQQGSLSGARSAHTLSALARSNEPAIVAGGLGADGPLDSLEVFTVNSMQDGCVNDQVPSLEVGCWIRPTGRRLGSPRHGHRAVSVDNDRKVLWVGGYGNAERTELVRGIELLDDQLNVSSGGVDLPFGAGELTATELADGGVLVTGGRSGDALLAVAVVLAPQRDPVTRDLAGFSPRDLSPTCILSEARFAHEAVRLTTGTVLLLGGISQAADDNGARFFTSSRRAEIFFPRVVDLNDVYPSPTF